jgi:hypothetical protein
MTRRGATGALVAAMASSLLVGCDAFVTPECDPAIVKAFRALPPVDGVEVELHGSPGIGCTDTVTVSDPDAFVDHYEQAMRGAGWSVTKDGEDVFGKGPSGGVLLDRLEAQRVGVYALSLDELSAGSTSVAT